MATIQDVYEIVTKADVKGINQATSAVNKLNNKNKEIAKNAATGAVKVNALKKSFAGAARGALKLSSNIGKNVIGALGKLAKFAGLAVVALGPLLIGGALAIGRGIAAMRDSIAEENEALGGMAEQAEVATEATDAMKSSLQEAAETAEEAAIQAGGAFGAFGQVGAGFVMAQGKVTDQVAEQAQKAADAATEAAEALEDEQNAAAGAARSTNDFVKAVDRISTAWNKAKKVVRDAIAKAITPALEEFAELLESPVFEEFIELLAEDMAEVLSDIASYIIKEVIPRLKDFMKAVNDAGGPIEYLKTKLNELKMRAKNVVDKITTTFRNGCNGWRALFTALWGTVQNVFNNIKDAAQTAADGVRTAFVTGLEGAAISFNALLQTAIGALNKLISAVEEGINGAIKPINEFINLFNSVSRAIGGKELKIIKEVSLPRIPIPELQQGGLSTGQTLAMIGDNPSGQEAVIPLDSPEALATLRDALGGGGMQIQNVNITVSDNNMANDFLNGLRARGVTVPL